MPSVARVVGGFEVGRFTPETVLRGNRLDTRATVEQLVAAAAPHDATNKGYLSQAELQKGAADLAAQLASAPTTTTSPSGNDAAFEYSRRVLADVKTAHLTGTPGRTYSDDEVVAAAARWDDGNGYLKKAELEAGALELQLTATRPLRASDVAAIRGWTGSVRKPDASPAPVAEARELGVVSDIDKTLMPPERDGVEPPAYPGVSTLLTLLEKGSDGTGALGDVTYVTARNPQRVTTVAAWLAHNGLPAGPIETGTVAFPLHVAEDNKVDDIAKVFRANPTQQFVLFGDTNHRDPEVYKRIRDMFPAQVKTVIMHDVKNVNPARVAGHELVKSYAEAAARLFQLRIIDEAGARSVMNAAKNEGLAITAADIDALIASHRP